MTYDTPTREPINSITAERPAESIKTALDNTNGALGELRAHLTDLNMLVGGFPLEEKTGGLDVSNMAEQVEANRRNAVACLELALRIKKALLG